MEIQKIKSKKDGLELEIAMIKPIGKPKGIVQISHGMSEHKGRYYDFMNYLAEHGYISVIHDHRGHGASVKEKKDLGYFYTENMQYIVDDLEQVTEWIQEKYQNLNTILFSHSMGTLVARNYLKKYDDKISKVILCGPPTENKLVGFGLFLAKLLKPFYSKNKPNYFLNKMTFGTYHKKMKSESEWICTNKDTVSQYEKDELCGFVFTTNGFINLYQLMKGAFQRKDWKVKNERLSILLIAGKEDKVIQGEEKFKELAKFMKDCGYQNVSYQLYDGMRHELLNERNKDIIYQDILNFLEKE